MYTELNWAESKSWVLLLALPSTRLASKPVPLLQNNAVSEIISKGFNQALREASISTTGEKRIHGS